MFLKHETRISGFIVTDQPRDFPWNFLARSDNQAWKIVCYEYVTILLQNGEKDVDRGH